MHTATEWVLVEQKNRTDNERDDPKPARHRILRRLWRVLPGRHPPAVLSCIRRMGKRRGIDSSGSVPTWWPSSMPITRPDRPAAARFMVRPASGLTPKPAMPSLRIPPARLPDVRGRGRRLPRRPAARGRRVRFSRCKIMSPSEIKPEKPGIWRRRGGFPVRF